MSSTARPAAPPASIQLFASDVDGTLLRPDHSLAPATLAAFGRLRTAGIKTALISARPPVGLVGLAKALDLPGPLGAFNGGTILSGDGTILEAVHLDPAVAARVLAMLDAAGVDAWVFTRGLWQCVSDANPMIPRETAATGMLPTFVERFDDLERVDKIVGVTQDVAALAQVADTLRAAVGQGASVARSGQRLLDVTPLAANKGDGVAAIARLSGVSLSRTAVIGDMENDMAMFARAGLSIAMGQALDAVRAAADHVTASNAEDGLAQAIDRFVLGTVAA